MELELRNAAGGKEELENLSSEQPIRFYYTNKVGTVEDAVQAEKNCGWGVCDPEGSKAWSAVGYFFAKKLARELGVTVGLIGCNWGGTSATNWIDIDTIKNSAELAPYLEEYEKNTDGVSLVLTAIAMMCAGWDGCATSFNPGFPQDGTWNVR